ncbi:MAG: Uncharacterised protein [uncultured Bacteroidota bacterium]|nr:MAG: Uncharacterised protein [uncultured Bacteroidetes bacterium]
MAAMAPIAFARAEVTERSRSAEGARKESVAASPIGPAA